MIIYDLVGGREDHPAYQYLEVANGNRQYDFLNSIIKSALMLNRPLVSHQVIKALNFHAICCLHTDPGEYRPCEVQVGDFHPPEQYRVRGMMDDFINLVNRQWESADAVVLAAYILWHLNHIHPFINGNGRTARAAAYFALCIKIGSPLPGETILPELLRQNRSEYVTCLKAADKAFVDSGTPDLIPLHALLIKLLDIQMSSAPEGHDQPDPPDASVQPS